MKRVIVFLILVGLISYSCKKEYKYYGFYINKTVEFDIENASSGKIEFKNNLITNSAAIFESKGTSIENIDSIYIDAVEIADSSFFHFSDLELYISGSGLSEISFSSDDNAYSSDLNHYMLDFSVEKMDDYIKASNFDITTKAELENTMTYPTKVIINLRFKVHSTVK